MVAPLEKAMAGGIVGIY